MLTNGIHVLAPGWLHSESVGLADQAVAIDHALYLSVVPVNLSVYIAQRSAILLRAAAPSCIHFIISAVDHPRICNVHSPKRVFDTSKTFSITSVGFSNFFGTVPSGFHLFNSLFTAL